MLKKVSRFLLRLIAGLAIGLAGFYVLVLLLNLGDAELDPDAARLAQVPALKVAPSDNAYYIIAGFGAPKDMDAQIMGEKYVTAMLKVLGDHPAGTRSLDVYAAAAPIQQSTDLLPTALRCNSGNQACAALYLDKEDAYRAAAEQHAHLLKRYADARAKPAFEELLIPDTYAPLPSLERIRDVRQIERALAVHAVVAGDAAVGLRRLAAIAAHDRLIFAQANSLVIKMQAARFVHDSAALAGELIRRNPALAVAHHDLLGRICAPLDAATMSMSRVFESEARTLMYMLANMEKTKVVEGSSVARSPFLAGLHFLQYQRHQTMNDFLELVGVYRAFGAASPRDLEPRFEELRAVQEKLLRRAEVSSFSILRNTVGKVLLGVGMPDIAQYKWRVVDLDGQLRLFGLQLALANSGVAASERSNWISRNAPDARSPYDDSPMLYDAATSALRFTGKGKHSYLPGDKTTLTIRLDN